MIASAGTGTISYFFAANVRQTIPDSSIHDSGNNVAIKNDSVYLRPEAQPVEQWDQLTKDQQYGLLKLLRMLREACYRPAEAESRQKKHLPWLFAESKMQSAFLNGRRGTGKTTLMTTLVGAIDDPAQLIRGRGNSDQTFDEVKKLCQDLHHRVVPTQPLDMEPLPSDTPLLAAILSRVYRAAKNYGVDRPTRGGLLTDDPRDQRELQRMQQYVHRIASTFEGNLTARKGVLDPNQFADDVMHQEDSRLELVSDLENVLGELSKGVASRLSEVTPSGSKDKRDGRVVFLIPIDDVDLNPRRCLELLRLLRTFAPPRELFFLLMGQYDLIQTIVKLGMASEYSEVFDMAGKLATVSIGDLQNELAEVSVANLRKMIPPHSHVELPSLSLTAALNFRPLRSRDADKAAETCCLMDLFRYTQLFDSQGNVARFPDLASLIARGRDTELVFKEFAPTLDARDLAWDQYCGAGTFQIPARRLVDLWMDLHELRTSNGTKDPSSNPADVAVVTERVRALFRHFWDRIVDADPVLPPEIREYLRREGPTAPKVVRSNQAHYGRDLEIEDASVRVENANSKHSTYRPRLRFAALHHGTGIPLLQVPLGQQPPESASKSRGGTSKLPAAMITYTPTRCATVLFHDIHELHYGGAETVETWPNLCSISPVTISWGGPDGTVASFDWPLPPLTTFVDMSAFLATWSEQSANTLNAPVVGTASSTIGLEEVEALALSWIVTGIITIQASLFGSYFSTVCQLNGNASWEEATDKLLELRKIARKNHDLRAWSQVDQWLCRIAELVQPELSSPAVSGRLIRHIESHKDSGFLNALIQEASGLLRRSRSARMNEIYKKAGNSLWKALNIVSTQTTDIQHWLFLKLEEKDQPTGQKVAETLSSIRAQLNQIQQQIKLNDELGARNRVIDTKDGMSTGDAEGGLPTTKQKSPASVGDKKKSAMATKTAAAKKKRQSARKKA